jgi:hypothetical protein
MGRDRRWMIGAVTAAAVVAGFACRRERAAEPVVAERVVVGPPLAESSFFRLELAEQPPCTAGVACEARLVLTALGDYKVNRDYPFKFVGEPAPGLEVLGDGTFVVRGPRAGAMTVRFRTAAPGTARVTGTFKLSVCTDDNCEIETPKIAFEVTAG